MATGAAARGVGWLRVTEEGEPQPPPGGEQKRDSFGFEGGTRHA